MRFTWSDVLTFVLGLLASALFVLGQALIKLDGETAVDWEKWWTALLIAELVSIGRYLTSRVPEWIKKAADAKAARKETAAEADAATKDRA